MKNLKFPFLLAFCAITFLFTACNDDEVVEPPVVEEVITNVVFTMTADDGTTAVFSWSDPDGEGGNDGVATSATLAANTTYTGAIVLTNASDPDDIEDVTVEIAEEDDEHQFFFAVNSANLTVAYGDADDDGNPLGLATTITTGDASTGSMTVTLRHEPNKGADGVAGGDITNAGGSTDVEIDFDVTIQ